MRYLLVLAAACSSSKPDKPAPEPVVADAGLGLPVTAKPSTKAPAPTKAAAPPDDPVAYHDAMKAGRKATDAKTYDKAIAAFDAALKAKPSDARALAERGFARLLDAKDLDAATADFDAAAAGTSEPKLLSMIWFNRGLTEEKRGRADNALAAFQRANDLRPTAAAKAKLKKPACPIIVERTLRIAVDAVPAVAADSWLALWKALPHEDDSAPTSEGEATNALTGQVGPTLPTIGTSSDGTMRYATLIWKTGTKLHALPVGGTMLGRCVGGVEFAIAGSTPQRIHVSGTEELEGGHELMCRDKTDELVVCSGAPNEKSAGTACLGGETFARDLSVDVATGKVELVVEEDLGKASEDNPPKRKVTVKLEATGLSLAGNGCGRTEPFAP